jgi:LCP family protein required for cell wall assembly
MAKYRITGIISKSPKMDQQYRKPINTVGQAKPGQDVIVAKKAANFPSVGMALPGYQPQQSGGRRNQKGASVAASDKRWRRWLRKVTLKRSVITLFIIVLLTVGFVAGKFIYNAHKLFGGSILGALSTTKLKGEDNGRVNILLAGNSSDDPGHNGADLTDSIMLISLDTRNNKAFLLSIPRDLWVQIPNAGHQKINDAYVVGQNDNFSAAGYPNGGMGQLEQIVSQDFDVPIDYYALINYAALKDAVNAVGSIDINIQSNDPRGLYDPDIDYSTGGPLVKLSNGEHALNGEQALDLARARGDAYGSYGFADADFDRTEHQREMLVAVKNKAETAGVLANPAKLTSLADAIGNNLTTDMKLSEVHRFYDLTKKINSSNIQSLSLNNANGKDLLTTYTSPGGESALIPTAGLDDFSDIQNFLRRQTSSNPVVQEDAKVVVLNGTDTDGLAGNFKNKLTAAGLDVAAVGDAQASTDASTSIIDVSGGQKPATRAQLVKLFGNNVTTQNPYAGVYTADFIIVLGQDQVSNTGSTTAAGQ